MLQGAENRIKKEFKTGKYILVQIKVLQTALTVEWISKKKTQKNGKCMCYRTSFRALP